MKSSKIFKLLSIIACGFTIIWFIGCSKDKATTKTYTILRPVYENKVSVLATINGSASESFSNPGKIYIKDNLIFINEIDKGIHVIDNTNPSHPQQIAFL